MVLKNIVRSEKTVCSDWIIVLKVKAETLNILLVQVYVPTSEYEDEEVAEFSWVCLFVERVLYKLNFQSLFTFTTPHILR